MSGGLSIARVFIGGAPRRGHGALWAVRERHNDHRVTRRRADRCADPAPGAHILTNARLAGGDLDGARHRTALRAHRAERARVSQARHGLNPGHAHFFGLFCAEHARLARRDTGRVGAHDARRCVWIDHGRARGLTKSRRRVHDGPDWARGNALVAPCATVQKCDFVDCSGWPVYGERERPADSFGAGVIVPPCRWVRRAGIGRRVVEQASKEHGASGESRFIAHGRVSQRGGAAVAPSGTSGTPKVGANWSNSAAGTWHWTQLERER